MAVRGVLREPPTTSARPSSPAPAPPSSSSAERIRPVPGSRAGLAGALDGIRARAETALGAGLDPDEEALARGFVLGQDDRIDPLVREQFRRAGLSHLLAVSGQNVVLLAILAGAGLALFGIGLRARLAATILIDRPLRAGRRRRAVDPARRRDGRGRDRWRRSPAGPRAGPTRRCWRRPRTLLVNPRFGERRRLAAELRGGRRDHALGGADRAD